MSASYVLVTNNPEAERTYRNDAALRVDYLNGGSYLDVLLRVRDSIHGGWHLMSHPQASNLKPNQCPWKTVLISNGRPAEEFARDVELIEAAIANCRKFTDGRKAPQWSEKALRDFMTVDLSVVRSALRSSLLQQMIQSRI